MNCINKLMTRGLSRREATARCRKAKRQNSDRNWDTQDDSILDDLLLIALAVELFSDDYEEERTYEEPTPSYSEPESTTSWDNSSDDSSSYDGGDD